MKKILKSTLLLGAAAMLLSACGTYDPAPIQAMKANTKFARALKLEYLNLHEEEVGEVDWGNASLFIEKAKMAASNMQVLPEELSAHNLPADSIPALESARYWLTSALRDGARLRAPYDAGHAQAKFDCWVEEQEQTHQPDDIAACRAEFEAAMMRVDEAMMPKPVAMAPKPEPKPAPKPAAKAAEPKKEAKKAKPKPKPKPVQTEYSIYFDFDSSKLTAKGNATVTAIVTAATRSSKMISLRAHADRSGGNKYNAILSKARADAVFAALRSWGVEADRISFMAVGEEEPAVATNDGVSEPMNRRVDVTLK